MAEAGPASIRSTHLRVNAVWLVALIASLLTSCSDGAAKGGTTWTVASGGGRHRFANGVELSLPPEAFPAGVEVSVAAGSVDARVAAKRGAPASDVGPRLVTDVFSIDVGSARLAELATLRIPVDATVGDDEVVYFATFDPQAGAWVPAGGTYDPQSRTLMISTNHFSTWAGFSWSKDRLRDTLKGIASTVFGPGFVKMDRVQCDKRALDVLVEVRGGEDGGLSACGIRDPDGALAVKVRNHRTYSVALYLPPGAMTSLDDHGGLSTAARKLYGRFLLRERSTAVIPSGATATVHTRLKPGETQVISAGPDGPAYLFDVLSVGITMYTTVAGGTTAPRPGTTAAAFANKISDTVDLTNCGYHLLNSDARNAPDLGLSPQLVTQLTKEAFSCLQAAALSAANLTLAAAVATVVGIITGLITGAIVAVEFFSDSVRGKAYRTIAVVDTRSSMDCSAAALQNAWNRPNREWPWEAQDEALCDGSFAVVFLTELVPSELRNPGFGHAVFRSIDGGWEPVAIGRTLSRETLLAEGLSPPEADRALALVARLQATVASSQMTRSNKSLRWCVTERSETELLSLHAGPGAEHILVHQIPSRSCDVFTSNPPEQSTIGSTTWMRATFADHAFVRQGWVQMRFLRFDSVIDCGPDGDDCGQ